MRDGVNVARAGHPVLVFVYDNFERVARAQASALGVPDLPLFVYPQYQPGGDSLSVEGRKGMEAAEKFSHVLLGENAKP